MHKQPMRLFPYRFTTAIKPSHLLADTGAATSLITPSQAALMGAKLQPLRRSIVIHSIGGQALPPLGCIDFLWRPMAASFGSTCCGQIAHVINPRLGFPLTRAIGNFDGAWHLCESQQRSTPISTVRQTSLSLQHTQTHTHTHTHTQTNFDPELPTAQALKSSLEPLKICISQSKIYLSPQPKQPTVFTWWLANSSLIYLISDRVLLFIWFQTGSCIPNSQELSWAEAHK